MTTEIPVAPKPPGYRGARGNLRAMRRDLFGFLEHLAAQGDFVRFEIGRYQVSFLNHPDLVQQVMVTQAKKFRKPRAITRVTERMFGSNLFTSDGEAWRVVRKSMQPAFHTKRIAAYGDVIVEEIANTMESWRDGETLNIVPPLLDNTMGVTTRTFLGLDARDQMAGRMTMAFLDVLTDRLTKPMPVWLPIKSNRTMKKSVRFMNNLVMPIIEERRRSGEDKGDLLSMLVLAQQADDSGILTDMQLRNEIMNLFAAGYELVPHTVAITLYLVSQHPHVEQRLLSEIDEVLGGRPPTVDDLPSLPYVEMVIKESMRLLPVTTVISRQAKAAAEIDGHVIPKGQNLMVAPWTLHRRPDAYSNPHVFDPERFSPEREPEFPRFAYIPFSTGPRVCLGNAFAMLQMRLTLASMLQRFRYALAPGETFVPEYRFNMRPRDGMRVVLQRR